jgi:hypothetical protein
VRLIIHAATVAGQWARSAEPCQGAFPAAIRRRGERGS